MTIPNRPIGSSDIITELDMSPPIGLRDDVVVTLADIEGVLSQLDLEGKSSGPDVPGTVIFTGTMVIGNYRVTSYGNTYDYRGFFNRTGQYQIPSFGSLVPAHVPGYADIRGIYWQNSVTGDPVYRVSELYGLVGIERLVGGHLYIMRGAETILSRQMYPSIWAPGDGLYGVGLTPNQLTDPVEMPNAPTSGEVTVIITAPP